ncbi:hypothetical protein CCHR01_10040 [Colletotrichum chrysophilum]|uniref:Uncharacterized protein n=1 Tax=Colletotrichum chrysophilum TaxID=1836956 RepID=A0AAD9AFM3_9PEZI|nr:hypothetical protein CCHR01_10040 [Colletotrichum chrysophilum]
MALKSVLLLVLLLSLAPGQPPPQQVTHSRHSSLVARHPSLAAVGWSGSRFPGRAREASLRRATSLGVLGSGVPGTSQSRSPVKRDDIDDPFCPPLPFQSVSLSHLQPWHTTAVKLQRCPLCLMVGVPGFWGVHSHLRPAHSILPCCSSSHPWTSTAS